VLLRLTVLALAIFFAIEYVIVPGLIGTQKDMQLLHNLAPAWLVAAVTAEAASILAYALLIRAVLPGVRPDFSRLARIVLTTTALGKVVPAGSAVATGAGYRLLTAAGVGGTDAAFAWVTASLGSAVVLNMMLWVALVVSIPMAGVHSVYVITALLGLLLISAAAFLVYALTRGEERAVRLVRAVGRHIPRVGADRMEAVVRQLTNALQRLSSDRRLLRNATGWAAANWLLDAAALWCFLAALGRYVEPFGLFVAYGIANVLAAIPITPGGLGIIDATTPALLFSFGITKHIATLGVLGWRLISYWLPIPVGVVAYLTLRLPPRTGGSRDLSSQPGRKTQFVR
jgi:uncharacterized protein (TIRG00374 family)